MKVGKKYNHAVSYIFPTFILGKQITEETANSICSKI